MRKQRMGCHVFQSGTAIVGPNWLNTLLQSAQSADDKRGTGAICNCNWPVCLSTAAVCFSAHIYVFLIISGMSESASWLAI